MYVVHSKGLICIGFKNVHSTIPAITFVLFLLLSPTINW